MLPMDTAEMLSIPKASTAAAAFLLVAGLFVCLPFSPANAEDPSAAGSGFYFAGKGGPAFAFASDIESGSGSALKDDSAFNAIGAFGMGIGYTWAKQGLPLRTEFEFVNRTEISYNASPLFSSSSSNDAVASDIQNITAMLKGSWHFSSGDGMWSPFVSAGVGLSRNAVTGQYTPAGGAPGDLDEVSYDLAWSVGVGASFYLGKKIVNDIELSYVDLGSVDWGRPTSTNLKTDSFGGVQLLFSLRYNF
jgi:opacity protein-like surface antigen